MGATDTEPNPDVYDTTTLRGFLSANYPLFAIMGVFGALAIYLTRIKTDLDGVNPNLMKLGVVVSLVLFLLVSMAIYLEFIGKAMAEEGMLPAGASPGLVVFFVPFTILVGTVVYVSTRFQAALFLLGQVIAFVLGWYVYALVFRYVVDTPEFDPVKGLSETLKQHDHTKARQYKLVFLAVLSHHFGRSIGSIILSGLLALIPIGAIGYIILILGVGTTLSTVEEWVLTEETASFISVIILLFVGIGIASIAGLITTVVGVWVETKRTIDQVTDHLSSNQ